MPPSTGSMSCLTFGREIVIFHSRCEVKQSWLLEKQEGMTTNLGCLEILQKVGPSRPKAVKQAVVVV